MSQTVLAAIRWKLPRWPFQKCIAEELDQIQVHMTRIISKIHRLPYESVEQFCIRRNHVCRQVCSEIGQWSVVWAKCIVAWHLHVTRSGLYASLLNSVFRIRDDNWLQHRRSHFVPSNGDISTRRSIRAGNLGTRLYVGYVQTRWETGPFLARQVLENSGNSIRGPPLTIGTRIRRAASFLQQFFVRPP